MDLETILNTKDLYVTRLPTGESFMWRLLTLREYTIFFNLRNSNEYNVLFLYNLVFERCYTGNPHLINGNLPAGIFCSIGELIMWLSGDNQQTIENEKEAIVLARNKYDAYSVKEVIKRTVLKAFPKYTPDDLEQWSWQKVMDTFVIAETILKETKENYQPIELKDIMTPADIAAKKKKIDFARENKELRDQNIGSMEHPTERPLAELFNNRNAQRNKMLIDKAKQIEQHRTEQPLSNKMITRR